MSDEPGESFADVLNGISGPPRPKGERRGLFRGPEAALEPRLVQQALWEYPQVRGLLRLGPERQRGQRAVLRGAALPSSVDRGFGSSAASPEFPC